MAAVLALASGPAPAQCRPECPPQGDATLAVPSQARPGAKVAISLSGGPRCAPALIGVSTGGGPLCLPWGKVCLSAPIVAVSGCSPLGIETTLPEGTPRGSTFHFQGLVLDPRAPNGFVALSGSRRLVVAPSGGGGPAPAATPVPARIAEHVVYSDRGVFDTLGTYFGGQGQLLLAEQTNSAVAPEGVRYMQVSFSLPARGGWAGLFIQKGAFNTTTTVDLRSYRPDGYLRFFIRSKHELEVGIRSQNIAPGQERSKFLLRKEGFAKLNGQWEAVAVPLAKFKALEPRLDFSKAKILFGLAVTTAFVSAPAGTFDFDYVRVAY